MCGLCGLVAARGAPEVRMGSLRRATAALRHRGPDGTNYYESGACAIGHTRLSIIDLATGDQPIWNEDRTVLTAYNGEIWNHRELRAELERAGHRFATRADTEVLVHGYEEWGADLPSRLNGMFAFAVWDERRETLLLARDRLGKKPLFLAETRDGLVFGSDIRSVLLAGEIRPELDSTHLAEHLFQRYVTAPHTLVRGVSKLPPGWLVTYDRSTVTKRPYWELNAADAEPVDAEELRGLLLDATRRRLMSDVPLGILLSGGVDSNTVLALMRAAGAEDVASFTIGFADDVYDERRWARLSAERFGTDHHEIVVGAESFRGALPRLAWYRDEPIAEPSEIPLLLLAELAGRHVKVVLTGDGGDEVFGGYPKYRAERLLRLGGPAAVAAMQLAGRLAARRPSHRRLERAVETLSIRNELLRWASWFRTFMPGELQGLLVPGLAETASSERLTAPLRDRLRPYADLDASQRLQIGDLLTYLPDNMLDRSDKVLMGASVEGRMPLVDYRIVERALRLPLSSRAGLRSPKRVLRDAAAELVPPEVLRQPKRGFPVPVTRLLLDDASPFRALLSSERTLSRGLFRPDALRALVHGHGRDPDRELKLFSLLSLELWLRTNVDGVSASPPEPVEVDSPRTRAHA
jgi:asparagine synthase (glutamine-hydrolysing)